MDAETRNRFMFIVAAYRAQVAATDYPAAWGIPPALREAAVQLWVKVRASMLPEEWRALEQTLGRKD